MSIGWGFAAGIGHGLYDVTDQRIKDTMLQRRELRAREAQMELEQYRTKMRREEIQGERSYLEKRSEIEAGREKEVATTEHQRAMEIQGLRGRQLEKAARIKAGKTGVGAKKQWDPLKERINEDGSINYIQQNLITGETRVADLGGAGGVSQMSEEDLNARTDEWASAKFGAWASEEDMEAAAEEIGYTGPLSRKALKFAYKELLRSGNQVSPAMPTDIGSRQIPEKVAQEGVKSTVTEKDKTEAAEAQKTRKALRSFMKKRGKTEEEIKIAEEEIFGRKDRQRKERVSAGMITGMGADQPVKQRTPRDELYRQDAQAQFAGFAKLPEQQKYAVFRIYSPYWTAGQRQQAKDMMPKAAKPKARSSYMGL